MKNKRVLYIFLTLLFLVLIVLFSSVLFSVKTAGIDFKGNNISLSEEQVDGIEAEFKKAEGSNIFFINESNIVKNLETKYPYINVINIERVFPSGIILHFSEREELYAVKTVSGLYAVIDCGGKVVALKEQNVSNYAAGDITDNVALDIGADLSAGEGDKPQNASIALALSLYESFNMLDGYGINDFRAFADKVTVNSESLIIKTRFGAVINIYKSREDLLGKIRLAVAAMNQLNDSERASGAIHISDSGSYTLGQQ